MAAMVPLFIRMALIHVVLIWGTNNVQTVGVHYTQLQIEHRSVGARLVLAARIFYAMYIWMCKLTLSEFLKRITIRIWRRSYEWALQGIRVFLLLTFIGVVVGTLGECQPFDHYWQVVPDPGPACRLGYGNLITMGTCDVITDILLIAFPIPIIMKAGQGWKRTLQLASLFSLSIILIIVTLFRVPKVIEMHGRQQYRTVWASSEILASAAVANTVIIGSFLRDKGTKKNKYRTNSVSDSIDNASARRPTLTALHDTGSDEDLFRFLGIRVPDHLQDPTNKAPRPAPVAEPAKRHPSKPPTFKTPNFNPQERAGSSSDSEDSLRKPIEQHIGQPSPVPSSARLSFFDVGGLLEDGTARSSSSPTTRRVPSVNGVVAQDFAPASPVQSRRGSQAQDYLHAARRGSRNAATIHLQDFGGLLTPTTSRTSSGLDRYNGRRPSDSHMYPPARSARHPPSGVLGPMLERHETQQSLQDAGGLLSSDVDRPGSHTEHGTSDTAARDMPPRERTFGLTMPRRQGQQDIELTELRDLGGILSEEHEPDVSTAAVYRATDRHPQSTSSGIPIHRDGGWESMDIQDPGGLLGK